MTVTASLRPGDLEMFNRLGVDADLLAAAGVCRVTHEQAREEIGIRYRSDHLEGIAFPYRDPTSGAAQTFRLRRDHPEVGSDGQPIAKYLQPPARHRLFFPPGAAALLADPTTPSVIVESEKASLALTAAATRLNRRLLSIATGGCWSWKGTNGKTVDAHGARVDERGPLADFDRVTWAGRDVVILFDANAVTNAKVQAAQRQLAEELGRRGARVRIGAVPAENGVNGPDDFRAAHDDVALFELLAAAQSAVPKATKAKAEKPAQGRAVQLEDPEPWPEPVDGAALLNALVTFLATYLALPKHTAPALALWVLHTYTIDACFVSPVLAVTSPVMRCAKTLLLIVLGALTPRRVLASNITAAGLFRTIEKFRPTLFIDEADTFLRDNDDLRGLLNSGHTRTTAVVIRPVGDDHEPRLFSTWCAKAVALIGKLPSTLADRSIEIAMRRRTADEYVQRLRQDTIDAEASDLRRQAARWAADQVPTLRQLDPEVPGALHDRAADCWRPLLAIADVSGGEWPERARAVALAISGSQDDPDIGTELLKDIQTVFDERAAQLKADAGAIKTEELLKALHEMADRPWPMFGKTEKPLSSHRLARLLKPFSIVSAGRLLFGDDGRHRAYRADAFSEAFTRYLPSEVSKCPEPNETGPEVHFSKCPEDPDRDTLKTAISSMNPGLRDTWTLRSPDSEGGDGEPF